MLLFAGCLEEGARPDIGVKTADVLRANGLKVVCRSAQTCCGLPVWQEGLVDEATKIAEHNCAALEGVEPIVAPSGNCVFMLREVYPTLTPRAQALAARVRHVCEMVEPAWHVPAGEKLALQPSCSLHAKGGDPAVKSLSALDRSHRAALSSLECCGFGGGLSAHQPGVADHLAARKLKDAELAGCTTLMVSDTGCLLHLSAAAEATGCPVRVRHIVELLDPKQQP